MLLKIIRLLILVYEVSKNLSVGGISEHAAKMEEEIKYRVGRVGEDRWPKIARNYKLQDGKSGDSGGGGKSVLRRYKHQLTWSEKT
jgi:hypothetical protein